MRIVVAALALLVVSVGADAQTPAAAPLVDAARFIDPVSVRDAALSPSAHFIAYISRSDTEEQVIVVDMATQTISSPSVLQIDRGSFDWVRWKGEDRLILGVTVHHTISGGAATGSHVTDAGGTYDINRVIAMNRDGTNPVQMFQGNLRNLFYGYGSSRLLDSLPNDPGHVLITALDNMGFGVWRGDITTGHVERVADGSFDTWYYETDGDGAPVMRVDVISDGSGYRIYRRAPGVAAWTFVMEARRAATTTNSPDFETIGSGPGAAQVYVMARTAGNDFSALYLYNTATGELGAPLQQGTNADPGVPWLSRTRELLATCDLVQRFTCQARDPAMERNLHALSSFFQNQANITLIDTSDDGSKWLLHVDGPMQPGAFFLYDVSQHHITPVATQYPHLDTTALSPVDVVNYASRDGAQLWAYVTARPGVSGPRPMVVLPHGGPEARDVFGYDPWAQFYASRGYVVLQPNFRGGSGFGKAFADAGRGQWGLRMQNDVTDAVHHMIDTGVADPHRICIVGGSYGGYAALAGVSLTPDLYRCAVSIAGISDLFRFVDIHLRTGRNSQNFQYWLRSIGDPGANHDALVAASPRLQAAHITAPVLLIHGEDDHIVDVSQSEMMQDALNSAGHPTRLILMPGEDHMWDTWSNDHRLTVLRETEAFLAQNLGASH